MEIPKVKEIRWNSLRGEIELVTEGGVESLPTSRARLFLESPIKRFSLSGKAEDKLVSGDWKVEFYSPVVCRLEEEEVICE
jgi:hypothetical protein